MTKLLTQEEGAALLGPHAETLFGCVDRSWQRWLANPDSTTASKRTRATTVYDYIIQEVETAFADAPDISITYKYGSLLLTIEGAAVIKFKKFRGRRLRTNGIATNERNRYLAQAGVLDGMLVTHLVVGYLLDELETTTEKIAVACPLGGSNLWSLDLGSGFNEQGGATPAPISPEAPDQGGTIIRSTKVVASDDTAVNEE